MEMMTDENEMRETIAITDANGMHHRWVGESDRTGPEREMAMVLWSWVIEWLRESVLVRLRGLSLSEWPSFWKHNFVINKMQFLYIFFSKKKCAGCGLVQVWSIHLHLQPVPYRFGCQNLRLTYHLQNPHFCGSTGSGFLDPLFTTYGTHYYRGF